MSREHQLKISAIKNEAQAIVISFESGNRNFDNYKAGQYLRLTTSIENKKQTRAYSICNYPSFPKVLIKRIAGGLFSNFAIDNLKIGDTLLVSEPIGDFVFEKDKNKTYLAVAAGSGITPIISHIREALSEGAKVDLFYMIRDKSSILLKTEIDALVTQFSERFQVKMHFSSEEGRATASQIYSKVDWSKTETLFCVPFEFQENILKYLDSLDVSEEKIHTELFFSPKSEPIFPPNKSVGATATLMVDEYGDEIELEISTTKALLGQMIENGIDINYGCKAGVCGACKCLKVEGEVEMKNHAALFEDEIEAGYILACQALAITDSVKLELE